MTIPPLINELDRLGIKVLVPLDRIIYKYTSVDVALKIIEKNSLLFSPPTSFNDPFDLTNALVDKSFDETIICNWIDSAAKNMGAAQRDNFYKTSKEKPQEVIIMMEKTLEKFKMLAGITCFSKSYTKTLMWSHYAEKHAGICLGFNIVPSEAFSKNRTVKIYTIL